MQSSTYLLLEKLILKGVTKNYEVTFSEGLNVVWGDMDTGKSSILNLVDYCFGGSNETLRYAEISSNARMVYLQVDLNGTRVTIERDLIDPAGAVRVYFGCFTEIVDLFPRIMSASPSVHMPDGWLSDFLLECLEIPRVKIKESKRDDADSDRLSIRDLFKLMYLKQTRVGSDNLLDYANPPLFIKNVEVQKFVYNVHNEALTILKGNLAEVMNERKSLLSERDAIQRFLASVNIETGGVNEELEGQLSLKDEELQFLDHTIQEIKNDFKLSSSVATELKARLSELRLEYDQVLSELQETEVKKLNFIQLRNTYRFDLENLVIARQGKAALGHSNLKLQAITCPLCESPFAISPENISDEELAASTKSFKNRIAGVDEAIEQLLEKQVRLQAVSDDIEIALKEKTASYDRDNFVEISGLIKSIEALEAARSELHVEVATLKNSVSIQRRFRDIDNSLENKSGIIEKIRQSIKEIESGATDINDVIQKLDECLARHMIASGLRNVYEVYFDSKFVPHFRGLSYYKATSGGVRTVLSIASFLVRMEYLLLKGGNLPPFLMIDTPGQNIGRNQRTDEGDVDEEVSDPMIYEKVYEGILETLDVAQKYGRRCQIIVVDNDLPKNLNKKKFHLVKRFSKSSKNFPPGLIDDAKSVLGR